MADEKSLEKFHDKASFFRATVNYGTFVGRRFVKTDFRRLEGRLVSFERCHFVDCDLSTAIFGMFISLDACSELWILLRMVSRIRSLSAAHLKNWTFDRSLQRL